MPCAYHVSDTVSGALTPAPRKTSSSQLLGGLTFIVPALMSLMLWRGREKIKTNASGSNGCMYNIQILVTPKGTSLCSYRLFCDSPSLYLLSIPIILWVCPWMHLEDSGLPFHTSNLGIDVLELGLGNDQIREVTVELCRHGLSLANNLKLIHAFSSKTCRKDKDSGMMLWEAGRALLKSVTLWTIGYIRCVPDPEKNL